MIDNVEFTFRLTNLGSAEGRVAIGSETLVATASYLSDTLGDLLRAVVLIARGAVSARASWYEEPGEYRWLFTRQDEDVAIVVRWFSENPVQPAPDSAGTLMFDSRCSVPALVAGFATGAREALDLYGEQGYAERWDAAQFPAAELETLEATAAT